MVVESRFGGNLDTHGMEPGNLENLDTHGKPGKKRTWKYGHPLFHLSLLYATSDTPIPVFCPVIQNRGLIKRSVPRREANRQKLGNQEGHLH